MDKKLTSEPNPGSHVAEAFRILRTNLQFSTLDNSLKTLLVTSPGLSEGKSTIAANLSIVMAQTGARVILVDCDLRWGEQHHLFNLPVGPGVANVLGDNMEINQVIRETRMPNLNVITCGHVPPNPSELLGSDKTKKVLAEMSKRADFILIDSPPTLMVADAAILSSVVDGCVLVVKSGKTKLDDVRQAKERLDKANARIVGTVLNGVEISNGFYNYDSHYYGKKYRREAAAGEMSL